MRLSDWSSDVCASDLEDRRERLLQCRSVLGFHLGNLGTDVESSRHGLDLLDGIAKHLSHGIERTLIDQRSDKGVTVTRVPDLDPRKERLQPCHQRSE